MKRVEELFQARGMPASSYSTVDDSRCHANYEEPEYSVYGPPPALPSRNRPTSRQASPSTARSLPTPLARHRYAEGGLGWMGAGGGKAQHLGCARRQRLAAGLLLALLLISLAVVLFLWHVHGRHAARAEAEPAPPPAAGHQTEPLISPNYLATLFITKRRVCLFEVSTSDAAQSRAEFEEEHVQNAQLLYFSNLSHSGVPVHPLQFQRQVRKLGVDPDCHVVLYDRGQLIWSAYAFWIFKDWKALAARPNALHKLESGPGRAPPAPGDFRAEWRASTILTFDDVLANFDSHSYDLLDAQNADEFEGRVEGAGFGHIKGARNLPIDAVFDWTNGSWLPDARLAQVFQAAGLDRARPVLVYDGTSLRSSVLWFALRKLGFQAAVYFGSWPEFVIRAPDVLKVLPRAQ